MWRDEAYLLDILIAAKQAKKFSEELTWEKFKTSSLHQHAIMRVIEIVGEAARKISSETKAAHPEVPWNDMIGMRHKLIHDYFRLDLRKVWIPFSGIFPHSSRKSHPWSHRINLPSFRP